MILGVCRKSMWLNSNFAPGLMGSSCGFEGKSSPDVGGVAAGGPRFQARVLWALQYSLGSFINLSRLKKFCNAMSTSTDLRPQAENNYQPTEIGQL